MENKNKNNNNNKDKNSSNKPTLRKRLAQLNGAKKKAIVMGKLALATTIGAIGAHAWQKTHIASPEQEKKNTIENVENVKKEVQEQMPQIVGTNTIGQVITDTTETIARTGAKHGGKVRETIAKWKAERKKAGKE